MVKLADARDSKSRGRDTVSVRPRPAAPKKNRTFVLFFFASAGRPFGRVRTASIALVGFGYQKPIGLLALRVAPAAPTLSAVRFFGRVLTASFFTFA